MGVIWLESLVPDVDLLRLVRVLTPGKGARNSNGLKAFVGTGGCARGLKAYIKLSRMSRQRRYRDIGTCIPMDAEAETKDDRASVSSLNLV